MPKWMGFVRVLRRLRRRFAQYNPAKRARKNVAHHYDLSGALYDLFLDTDRQYSCAYFYEPSDKLEDAQVAKKRHIAAKLNLDRPGSRCSTSARAGAGSPSTSPATPRPM